MFSEPTDDDRLNLNGGTILCILSCLIVIAIVGYVASSRNPEPTIAKEISTEVDRSEAVPRKELEWEIVPSRFPESR